MDVWICVGHIMEHSHLAFTHLSASWPKTSTLKKPGLDAEIGKTTSQNHKKSLWKKYETCKLQGKRICVPFVMVFKLWKVQSLVNKQLKQGGLKASNF